MSLVKRSLSMMLTISLFFGFVLAPLAVEAKEGTLVNRNNWTEEEPANNSEYWPLPDSCEIYNAGGASLEPLRASALNFINQYTDEQGNMVYELEWVTGWNSGAAGFPSAEIRIDSLMEPYLKNFQMYSEKSKSWITPAYSNLVYGFRRETFFDLGLGADIEKVVPIRITLDKEATNVERNFVIQLRTWDPNTFGKPPKVFCKFDTNRPYPATYLDYTYSTILPIVESPLSLDNKYDLSATSSYIKNAFMTAEYDSQKNAVRVMYKYTHNDYNVFTQGRPFLLEETLSSKIYHALDHDRSIKLYTTDHNGKELGYWYLPTSSIFDEEGKKIIRIAPKGFQEAAGRPYFEGPGDGKNVLIHDTISWNPVSTVIEYPIDKFKTDDLFKETINGESENLCYTMLPATGAYFTTAQKIREFRIKVPSDMSIPAGGELKINFPDGSDMWSLVGDPKMDVFYGPSKPIVLKESNWGKNYTSKFEYGVSLKKDDELILLTDVNLKKTSLGTVTFPNGETSPITLNNNQVNKNLILKHSYAATDIILKRTFFKPKINEVFTEDKTIIGNTKEGEWDVQLFLGEKTKGEHNDYSNTYLAQSGKSPDHAYHFDIGSGGAIAEGTLKKDMRILVRNNKKDEFPSSFTETRVKAHVNFDTNYSPVSGDMPKIIEKIAPENDKFLGEEGYLDLGFANGLPKTIDGVKLEDVEPEKIAARTWPTVPTRDDITNEAQKPYFAEWNKKVDGTGEVFKENTPITESLTVYAIWGHMMTFDPNGGGFMVTGDPGMTAPVDAPLKKILKPNEVTSVPDMPVREGYLFLGWSTDKEATAENWESTKFEAGSTLEENITAYAVWKAVAEAPQTIKCRRHSETEMTVIGKAKPMETLVLKDGENFINKETGEAITPAMLEQTPSLAEKVATVQANAKGIFKLTLPTFHENGVEIGEKELKAHVYIEDNPIAKEKQGPGKAFKTPKLLPKENEKVSLSLAHNFAGNKMISGEASTNVEQIKIFLNDEEEQTADFNLETGRYHLELEKGLSSQDKIVVKAYKDGAIVKSITARIK